MKVGVSGHQQMPAEACRFARRELTDHIRSRGNVEGVCSLAAGADQVFAEAVLATGGTLHVVIPCASYDSTMVGSDLRLFRRLRGAASSEEVLSFSEPSEAAFLAAGKRVADLADELVAVWDGQVARGVGGTADIVTYTKSLGKPVTVIWPHGVTR